MIYNAEFLFRFLFEDALRSATLGVISRTIRSNRNIPVAPTATRWKKKHKRSAKLMV